MRELVGLLLVSMLAVKVDLDIERPQAAGLKRGSVLSETICLRPTGSLIRPVRFI